MVRQYFGQTRVCHAENIVSDRVVVVRRQERVGSRVADSYLILPYRSFATPHHLAMTLIIS
jgi:hypothetical protein